jgi:hypothetical protein
MKSVRIAVALAVGCVAWAAGLGVAEAQYKNGQFGFEGGYLFLGNNSQLNQHNYLLGLRGGYKASDHWWFTARAGLSFPAEDQQYGGSTVVFLHIVPIDARYYFQTDSFRPFVGVTNSFQLLFNQDIGHTAEWGPGVTAGMEFKLHRDLFLGFQLDSYWIFVFEGTSYPLISLTSQLLFFF